jgi:hypothetical protein
MKVQLQQVNPPLAQLPLPVLAQVQLLKQVLVQLPMA